MSVCFYQHCWGRSPCPGRSAPASPVVPQLHLQPHPSPAPPGQRSGGGAGPAGPERGRARKRSGPPSSAAAGATVTIPRGQRGCRPRRFQAATLRSSSVLRLPCPAMAASRVSRRQRGRRRGARCHRMSRWPTADWQRSLQRRERKGTFQKTFHH